MGALIDFLRTLTNPERLIEFLSTVMSGWLSYAFLCAIVFSETGLLVGFFLPGDSLLFTVGVIAGAGQLNIALILGLLIAACILGNASGYTIGRKTGPKIFDRPDSRFFKQDYLQRTKAFYEKHGGKTIIYAQFVPIIRTFAAFVAGVAQMPYTRFASFNVIGAVGWVTSMTLSGYFLGNVDIVRKNFEKVVILIVLVSLIPVFLQVLKARRTQAEPAAARR